MRAPAADINIRDNYLAFHHKSIYECNVLGKKLNRLANAKTETWQELIQCKDDIQHYFKIILNDNVDYISLGNKLAKEFRKNDNSDRRNLLIVLIKYCSIIKNETESKHQLDIANKKKDLSFSDYRYYVFKYYSKVHKFLLEGKAYRYRSGIGTLYINRTQVVANGHKIDFHKTKLRKEELKAKGVKLYNKFEAQEAVIAGEKYDGVDYRVWLRTPAFYSLKFINSYFFRDNYDFQPISYIHQKYREYNQDSLAFEFCKSNEDIYDLQIDLRTKIAIYLKRNPERYINFDRKFSNE